MIRTQIQLTDNQMKILRTLSARQKTSVAELIRQAVDRMVSAAIEIDREEQKRRAIAIAGRFCSDVNDLGTNHDRYLAQAYHS